MRLPLSRTLAAVALAGAALAVIARRRRDGRAPTARRPPGPRRRPASAHTPHVVIVGAGFAGLRAARTLTGAPVHVTVIDRHNHHLFQPLLYQVATGVLSPADIAAPVREVLRGASNVEVLLGTVDRIDPEQQRVHLADGAAVPYDFLVIATGATHSYFGHDEWAPFAPGPKTLEDALEIRRRVLTAFERAERETDPDARRALLTFVVVGAGPTGVELAGALAEISRRTLARDYRQFAPETARVILLEATGRVLPPFPAPLSSAARAQLERLGVEVRTGAMVTGIDGGGVTIGPDRIASRTVLWGAGVAASPLAKCLATRLDRSGRIQVAPELNVPGHWNIFVAGDLAGIEQDGKPVPGVAPAAIQEGRHVARNVLRLVRGRPPLAFRYRDKGTLATIGRAAAVGTIGKTMLTGSTAWWAWLIVHIFFLIGFRNRVSVLLQWAWSYLTFRRSALLITDTAEQWRFIHDRAAAPPPDAPHPETPPARA